MILSPVIYRSEFGVLIQSSLRVIPTFLFAKLYKTCDVTIFPFLTFTLNRKVGEGEINQYKKHF